MKQLQRSLGLLLLIITISYSSCMRKDPVKRPKIVIGLVVDQMRWDYLYRYYDMYGEDGFKKLLKNGFACQNTMVNYLPTFTGPGHTCVYTGSVPSIHGIAGNNWLDNQTGQNLYCVDDNTVWLAGDATKAPSYSPRNLLTTTITDELRLATNFRAKTFGIAIKDRGAILPAGHTANAAYWYNDKTGDFVTSTYYDTQYQNPNWLKTFNKKKEAESLASQNWNLLYDPKYYGQSTADLTKFEDAFKGESDPVFPHKFLKSEHLTAIRTIPAGNTLTFDMARACIEGESLGNHGETDFLAISLSPPDYTGHQFAPNSVEAEDMYLRLDQEIAEFLHYLDKTYGKDCYLLFLTADHAGAHNPEFLKSNKIPAGISFNLTSDLNRYLQDEFKTPGRMVDTILNYEVYLNDTMLATNKAMHKDEIKNSARNWLLNIMPGKYNIPVSYVADLEDMSKGAIPEPIRNMIINGYHRNRSGCLQIILNSGWFESDRFTGTTHGSWNPYDTHIPLIWYGWNVPKGETHRVTDMTDISATLAAMLHIQMPNGCIGKPITEIVK